MFYAMHASKNFPKLNYFYVTFPHNGMKDILLTVQI